MSNNIIQQRVLKMESFQRQYKQILKTSVVYSMPSIQAKKDINAEQIDWNNLLSLSSILAKGEDFNSIDAALRIAQSCLVDSETTETQRLASAVILEELTNKQSIKLAISRNLLSKDFREKLPLPLRLDILKKEF